MTIVYKGSVPVDLQLSSDLCSEDVLIEIHESVESTNSHLRLLTDQKPSRLGLFALVCADEQTAGRGRLQRQWHSPAGQNIYTSFGFALPAEAELSGLSLVVGLCLRRVIMRLFPTLADVTVKWPNDLLDKKRVLLQTINQVKQSINHQKPIKFDFGVQDV